MPSRHAGHPQRPEVLDLTVGGITLNLCPAKNEPSITEANSSALELANVGRGIRIFGTPRAASLPLSTATSRECPGGDQLLEEDDMPKHVLREDLGDPILRQRAGCRAAGPAGGSSRRR